MPTTWPCGTVPTWRRCAGSSPRPGPTLKWKDARRTPDVKPFLGYTRQFQESIGFPDADSWNAWLEMSLPVCNLNQGYRARAAARAAQGQFELEAGLVELRAEIEVVVEEFRAARAKADLVAPEQLRLAEQVRDAVDQAYRKGDQTLVDVLDAQRNYHETYRTHITGRANYWRALYRFNAAIGKQALP